MAKRVQLIRGTTGQADAFQGLVGEITADTTKKELRLHDGLTAGGIPIARADLNNVAEATAAIAGKLGASDKIKLNFLTVTKAVDLDKTDFITVTQPVNLDTIESDATAAAAELAFIAVTQAVDLDAIESKLDGIEANATADQTGAEIKSLYEAEANTNVLTDTEKTDVDNLRNRTARTAIELSNGIGTIYFTSACKDVHMNSGNVIIYHGEMRLTFKGTQSPSLRVQWIMTTGGIAGHDVVGSCYVENGLANTNITQLVAVIDSTVVSFRKREVGGTGFSELLYSDIADNFHVHVTFCSVGPFS